MSDRASLLNSEWKVLVDGVEVPHQGFTVQFQKNALSTATIVLEPDASLTKLRPQSVVSIWARERFIEDENNYQAPKDILLNRYYLYWEGLLSSTHYEKSPQSRAFRLICESMFNIWGRSQAFMSGIGPIHKSSIRSGSAVLNPNEGTTFDVFSMTQLANKFSKGDEELTFTDRIIRTITYLASLNGNLRLQTSRYKLLNKISGITDNVYQDLLGPFAANMLADTSNNLSESSTVFQVISRFQDYGFYSNIHLPIPNSLKLDKPEILPSLSDNDSYSFTAKFKRNEFLIIPETYFAMPPPCNLIFPEMIRDLSVTREFYNEPTRTIVNDPFLPLQGYVFYLAPAKLLRTLSPEERNGLTAAEVFAAVISAISEESAVVDSPYQSVIGDTVINTLTAISGPELEKGIVATIENYPFETLAAYVRAKGLGLEDDDSAGPTFEAYNSLITAVAEYRHSLSQYTRALRVNLNGHRYLVPGFSAAVFDSDISYFASVDTVLFSVDPLGTESTSAMLTKARPIVPLKYEDLTPYADKIDLIVRGVEFALNIGTTPFTTETVKEETTYKLIAEANLEIERVLEDFRESVDIPIAPSFFNPDLLDSKKLDRLYGELLGCKPLYSTAYNSILPLSTQEGFYASSDAAKEFPQLLSLYNYAEGVTTLNNVFNMFGLEELTTQRPNVTSWQEVSNSTNSLGITPYEWIHRTFLKRRKIYLREYIEDHDLQVLEINSNEPTPAPFFVLVPSESLALGSDGWDNSIFSKLVMETEEDPIIAQLRIEAPEYLKTGPRQRVVINYAKKHFGARAFDGS